MLTINMVLLQTIIAEISTLDGSVAHALPRVHVCAILLPVAIRLRVPKPELFSFAEAMKYTTRGFDDPRYVVGEEFISTAIAGSPPERITVIRVSHEPETLAVELLRDGAGARGDARGVERYVRRWFDLDRDLSEWEDLVRRAPEPVRSAFSRLLGFRLVALPSLFEALAWCIIGQQIHLGFAYRLKRRLSERYAAWADVEGRRHYLFPTPAALAAASRENLREMQLSYRKADYLIGLAALIRDGELSEDAVAGLGDTPSMMRRLRQVRGIGEWSAAYGLLKGLGRRDAVPYGDSGLAAAYAALFGTADKPSRGELEDFFSLFPGWEGYAAFYLWRTLLTDVA
ncbi:MAG: DNA-3-methyladenine glycosylase family protein [Spirochaetaceae bacterium]